MHWRETDHIRSLLEEGEDCEQPRYYVNCINKYIPTGETGRITCEGVNKAWNTLTDKQKDNARAQIQMDSQCNRDTENNDVLCVDAPQENKNCCPIPLPES